MKDAQHHLKRLQRKVIQSLRKETQNAQSTQLNGTSNGIANQSFEKKYQRDLASSG